MKTLQVMVILSALFCLVAFEGCRGKLRDGGGCAFEKVSVDDVLGGLKDGQELLVVFSADWCKPCKELKRTVQLSPRIQAEIARRYKDNFYIVNVDDYQDLVKDAKVDRIPCVIRYKVRDGKPVEEARFTGLKNSKEILDFIR